MLFRTLKVVTIGCPPQREDGGGGVKELLDHTTPSARTNEASRLFLNRAATPPPAEEGSLEPVPCLGLRSNLIGNWAEGADLNSCQLSHRSDTSTSCGRFRTPDRCRRPRS